MSIAKLNETIQVVEELREVEVRNVPFGTFAGTLNRLIVLQNGASQSLEFYDEAGQLTIAYKLYRCWVSEYSAMPDLDPNANAVAIQHIKLENEGWDRDYPEPRFRPSFRW
jgi:hypothetical protein